MIGTRRNDERDRSTGGAAIRLTAVALNLALPVKALAAGLSGAAVGSLRFLAIGRNDVLREPLLLEFLFDLREEAAAGGADGLSRRQRGLGAEEARRKVPDTEERPPFAAAAVDLDLFFSQHGGPDR